jgi:hypothetical protein
MHFLAVDFYQCIIPDLLLQQALGVFQKKDDPNFSINIRTMLKMNVLIPLTRDHRTQCFDWHKRDIMPKCVVTLVRHGFP